MQLVCASKKCCEAALHGEIQYVMFLLGLVFLHRDTVISIQSYAISKWSMTSSYSFFTCSVRYRTVYITTYFTTYQTRYFCCSGYSAVSSECKRECLCHHNSAKRVTRNVLIAAVCSPTCKNSGTCTSPGRCHCSSGWTGSRCTTRKCTCSIYDFQFMLHDVFVHKRCS